MSVSRHYVLAAGGTGGHMMPAQALAKELEARGHRVALITDERGAKIPGIFEDVHVHRLPAGRITGNPLSWFGGFRAIMKGRAMARQLYKNFQPSAVIGFGGYPAFPALLGARADGVPTMVHEQNAVLGRVNRMVARWVTAIATSSPETERMPASARDKVYLVGNPVREEVLALRGQPYPIIGEDSIFRVLVTGGSQGASILSEVVPAGLAMLPPHLKARLQVVQQCREADIDNVRDTYSDIGIAAELATYLPDLPAKLAVAHLVIARSGASTLAELAVAGRPAILIPLPIATDDHQTANAREMATAGGARVIQQRNFTPTELAKQMQKLGLEPVALANAAERAWNCGRPNATKDLADLVEGLGAAPDQGSTIRVQPTKAGAIAGAQPA